MKRLVTLVLSILLMICCLGLVACHKTHTFDQEKTEAIYRKTFATCGSGAVYYQSCVCGEKGEETFDAGAPLGHSYVNRECQMCHDILDTSEGLIFKSYDDETCFVSNKGFCTDIDIVIPAVYEGKTVIGINDEVFKEYDFLESIVIPNTISSIGKCVFSGCSNLKTVSFAEDSQLNSIDEGAFEFCYKLTSFTIPSTVKTINMSAFSNCVNLEEITMPDSLTSIGWEAFKNCASLKNIIIPNGVQTIGDGAFEACSLLESVTIPSSVSDVGVGAFASCEKLTKIELNGNQNFRSIDGNLYSKDGKTLIQYAIGKSANSFVVPDGVTVISEKAFSYSKNLISITLPKTLTTIDKDAFNLCDNLFEIYNLSKLQIVKESYQNGNIANNARDVYTSLNTPSKLKVENGVVLYKNGQEDLLLGYIGSESILTIPTSVTKIEKSAFEYNLTLESISIPNTVTIIAESAFAYCSNLKHLTIGKGVSQIQKWAFFNCNKLESITYEGTKTEWNSVEKGSSWDFSTGDYTITCSDGVV